MITYYKSVSGELSQINSSETGSWINVVEPTENEIKYLISDIGLDEDFIRSSLDEEESSHIINELDQTLIIIDIPIATKELENTILYTTVPIGIIIKESFIITISSKENPVVSDFSIGSVRGINTSLKTQFLLKILLRVASKFLQYLKQIDKIANVMELKLHKSMKNKELIQLLGLEKSLVYFSTSLKANEVTLEKILRGRALNLYDDDQDLLEDVLIEIRQAIEMSNIYSSILSGTMDAFASIISNNLNIVMKVLTSITILMAIPTMIFSFYGMNVIDLPLPYTWFAIGLSVLITVIVMFILIKTKMFK